MLDGFEILIEFIHERNASRDVKFQNFCFAEVIEVLDQSAKAVAVGGDDDFLSGSDFGSHSFVPVGQHALDGILEALGYREICIRECGISWVIAREAFVGFFQSWWGDVVAASPDLDLVVSKFSGCFRFVETLQCAVVAFVESPAFLGRDP